MTGLKKTGAGLAALVLALTCLATTADAKKYEKKTAQAKKIFNSMTVTAIDADSNDGLLTITAQKKGVTYTIDATNTNARKIMRRNSAKAEFSEILTGDNLKIWGTLSGTIITATKIRDNSIFKLGSSLKGTVTDIDRNTIDEEGKSTYQQFNLHTRNRGDLLVRVYATTSIIFHGAPKSFSDLNNDDAVEVKGFWNKSNSLVYNTTRVKIKTQATMSQ